MPTRILIPAVLFCICSPIVDAGSPQWPHWRGPQGTGHSAEKYLPVKWDASNVAWKTPIKGNGQSSPVIWGDRVFLTSAVDKGKKRLVICINRQDGKILWERTAWTGTPEPAHRLNGWASSTCVTDGERVYASFGKAGVHCYSVEGKHQWSKQLGEFLSKTKRGTASSLALTDSMVIFNGDSKSDPYLFGLDKNTGDVKWKTKRPATEGYSTPLWVTFGKRQQVILNGHYYVAGYDGGTGKLIWKCKSFAGRGEPTPTLANGLLYIVNGQPGDVYAVRPGGTGDVSKTHMAWHTKRRNGRDQPSPIVANGHLIVCNIAGIATCYDATSGKEIWRERISTEKIYGSPVAAAGKVYFLNEAGVTIVLQPGPKLNIVARNRVTDSDREIFRSSPIPCNGQFFLRAHGQLYCVGKKTK